MTGPHFVSDIDYYALLSVPRSASFQEIRRAFHRLVLQHHPDKQPLSSAPNDAVDIVQLTSAYATLSDPSSREEYDSYLNEVDRTGANQTRLRNGTRDTGRRPAEVVSLDDFNTPTSDTSPWTYPCRCGDTFNIREEDMEKDVHLLECGGCSEMLWVEYEEAEEGSETSNPGDEGDVIFR